MPTSSLSLSLGSFIQSYFLTKLGIDTAKFGLKTGLEDFIKTTLGSILRQNGQLLASVTSSTIESEKPETNYAELPKSERLRMISNLYEKGVQKNNELQELLSKGKEMEQSESLLEMGQKGEKLDRNKETNKIDYEYEKKDK